MYLTFISVRDLYVCYFSVRGPVIDALSMSWTTISVHFLSVRDLSVRDLSVRIPLIRESIYELDLYLYTWPLCPRRLCA